MNADNLARRYFPALLCLMIAIAAYFQASGLTSLVAESLKVDPSEAGLTIVAPAWPAPTTDEHTTSAAPILARNPFDSITGALDMPPLVFGDVTPETAVPGDPYAVPACDSGRVLLIVKSDDDDWSLVIISNAGAKSVLRRRGDEVAGRTVQHIGWDRVWLTTGSMRCQLRLGSKEKVAKLPAVAAVPVSGKPVGARLPPEIAAKIQRVSDREFNVDRGAIDLILERQAELMRSARIIPEKNGATVIGIRLQRVGPGSLLDTLGLKNGDRIQSINGFELTDPQKALEAYTRVRTADHLRLAIHRDSKDMTIDFHIR